MLLPPLLRFPAMRDNMPSTPAASTLWGTAVTGGASAYGSSVDWGGGALDFECQLLRVCWALGNVTNTNTSSLIDILVDPAGGTSWSSTPIIPDLLAGFAASNFSAGAREMWLPLRIPRGSNLGMRARSLTTGRTHRVLMTAYGGFKDVGTWRTGTRVEAYGVDSSTTYNGTLVSPSASSGVWGSWTNIGSTTPSATWWHYIIHGGVNGTSTNGHAHYWQIGAGSQPLSIDDTDVVHTEDSIATSENTQYFYAVPVIADLPAGTQLQARQKNSSASGVDNACAIYAVVP